VSECCFQLYNGESKLIFNEIHFVLDQHAELTGETVERMVSSSLPDEVDVFLQSLQHTQEHKDWLNIGGVKYETSKVTLLTDPASVLALMLLPNSPFRPSENFYFFDPSHFRIS